MYIRQGKLHCMMESRTSTCTFADRRETTAAEHSCLAADPAHGVEPLHQPDDVARSCSSTRAGDFCARQPADSSSEVSGILEVSGPLVFKEYFGRPEDTAKEFTEDGWFRTGDSAACDLGGSFRILGRTSVDIIKSGGYKISALEVEAAFFGHPALAECAVVAVPDDTWGERLVLVAVPAPGQPQADLAGLQAWAAQRLAKYKWPRELRILDSLPRNAMGKVNKKQLKLMVQSATDGS
ncbi:hypothetical protein BOX15_Mlig004760g1 [Macrostomum lignano]|uniref:AMP-binding enzyme C-terminal domain-containing protein n=1 Tax=Macrostomum lignano TaxID=282301 RepID=A0A267E563_9PLAT|nr:hypothetical protein BOX15_Mlig004760g1 [Macrostomum lignano]